MSDLEAAVKAIKTGNLVVYPTETVYGLGADALNPTAVERVFKVKGRPSDNPLSMAVSSVDAALAHTNASEIAQDCMQSFLPGPVTVICAKHSKIPDTLTGGRQRVGIRIPEHEVAQSLLQESGPITATSANRAGQGSVNTPAGLDRTIRDAVSVILDGGETPGSESTVVDPARGIIHRRGRLASAVESWLEEH